MTTIPIDKASIKKNPNAGSTQSHFFGQQVTTFKTICTKKELEKLEDVPEVHVSKIKHSTTDIVEIEGSLISPEFMKLLPGKYQVDCNNNIQTINHFPIPNYSYEYENTPIECEECKNLIPFNEIERDYFATEDDIEYEICPICKEHDTFEYKFETIEEALNL